MLIKPRALIALGYFLLLKKLRVRTKSYKFHYVVIYPYQKEIIFYMTLHLTFTFPTRYLDAAKTTILICCNTHTQSVL